MPNLEVGMQADQVGAIGAVCTGLPDGMVLCTECTELAPPTRMNRGAEGLLLAEVNTVAFCPDNRPDCGLTRV